MMYRLAGDLEIEQSRHVPDALRDLRQPPLPSYSSTSSVLRIASMPSTVYLESTSFSPRTARILARIIWTMNWMVYLPNMVTMFPALKRLSLLFSTSKACSVSLLTS